MAGLGNYVHLSQPGYQATGIGQNSQGVGFSSALIKQRETILSLIDKQRTAMSALKLQKYLNNLRDGGQPYSNNHIAPNHLQAMENTYYQAVQQSLNKNIAVWENASLDNSDETWNALIQTRKAQLKNGQKAIQVRTASRIIEQINILLTKAMSGQISPNDQQLLENIKLSLMNQIQTTKGYEYNYIPLDTSINGNNGETTVRNLLIQYNTLIKRLKMPTKTMLGNIAEIQVATLLSALTKNKDISAERILKDLIQGTQSQQTKVILDSDIVKYGTNYLKDQHIYLEEGTDIAITSSAQTIDVNITIQDPIDQIEQRIKASVKNYENIDYQSIKVISGTNLFNLLGIANTDFANHYLNLIVQQTVSSNEFYSYWKQADQTMSLLLLARGLMGYRSGNKYLANYLIVNERASKKFKVFTTSELLEFVENRIDNLNSFIDIFPNLPEYRTLKNIRHPKWWGARVAQVLAETKKYNLKASLKPALLQQVASQQPNI